MATKKGRRSGETPAGSTNALGAGSSSPFTAPPSRLQRLVRLAQLPNFVGLSRTTVYEQIAAGAFPKPVALTETGCIVAWFENDLIEWQQKRRAIQESDEAPPKMLRKIKRGFAA